MRTHIGSKCGRCDHLQALSFLQLWCCGFAEAENAANQPISQLLVALAWTGADSTLGALLSYKPQNGPCRHDILSRQPCSQAAGNVLNAACESHATLRYTAILLRYASLSDRWHRTSTKAVPRRSCPARRSCRATRERRRVAAPTATAATAAVTPRPTKGELAVSQSFRESQRPQRSSAEQFCEGRSVGIYGKAS